MKTIISILAILVCITTLTAQSEVLIEGYIFEQKNRGYLNQVKINISEVRSGQSMFKGYTNIDGFFTCNLPAGQSFILSVEKNAFIKSIKDFSTSGDKEKVFLSIEMERKPGYIFEATLAPSRDSDEPVDAILGAKIEVYNNTLERQEVLIPSSQFYSFTHVLEPGNHYTMMIRKKGFYNKRIEAHVNIDGCILCIEGTGVIRPGVLDNLTDGLSKGSLLSNVEMQPIELGKGIEIPDIYYDYDKATIRKSAAKVLTGVIQLLKDNPALIVEMGSHTDSRGKDEYNKDLANRRADAVVDYMVENGDIPRRRLSAFGYGETEIKNKCKNGVPCGEELHQVNRRTEMKVVGILDYDPYSKLTLAEIIQREQSDELIDKLLAGEADQNKSTNFEDLPPEVQREILISQGKLPKEEEKEIKEEISHPIEEKVKEEKIKEEKVITENSLSKRILSFKEGYSGYSVHLGKLPGPTELVEKNLLEKHGKIFKKGEKYYLGTFDKKKQAKKFKSSLQNIYPYAQVEYFE